jgi:hypothetical protein
MRITQLLTSLLVLALSGCAQPKTAPTNPTETEQNNTKQPFSEKCDDAKAQLDKAVAGGQLTELRELKRHIELYCVWRRN